VTAYAPLGANAWPYKREELKNQPTLLEDPVIKALAEKYGKSVG